MSASSEELIVEVEGAHLAGTMWRPSAELRSIVVMHPGSGPSDRDNDVHFPPIRTALLAAGHAIASFDKRGVGASTGSLWTTSIEQQADDMIRCARAVSQRVADVPVGAFGHSQGGWVAYEAVGTSDVFDFAVANSGPGVTPAAQERHALETATQGNPDQTGALDLFDELLGHARARRALSDVVEQVNVDRAGSLRGFAAGLLQNDDEWELASLIMSYDPMTALAAIKVPLLCVFGADDPIVPVEASVAALRRYVDDALLRTVVFDGGGHRLEPTNGEGFVAGYLDTLTAFVADHSNDNDTRT